MCGFLFYFNISKKYKKIDFLKSAKLLQHRGPDDYSDYFDDHIAIAFYRLSIRDLSKYGRQPMFSKSKKYVMVFNGEIYNTEEIKSKFGLKNLHGNSDSEVLLEFLESYGIERINNIKGMFSVVLYDLESKKILALRDRFGIKPLYYLKTDSYILFSSEIKPLLKYSKLNKINNSSLLSFFLKGQIENDKNTLFDKIKSLEPANYLISSKSRFTINTYWKLNNKVNSENLPEAKDKILSKLKNSLNSHLISDKKVGLFLSGGTDSATIAKILKNYGKSKFDTFTYDFNNNNGYSELEKAKFISKELKIKNFHCEVSAGYVIDNFEKIVRIIESPITSLRLFGVMKLYETVKKNKIDVILEGHGGDEMLGGYKYNYLFNLFSNLKGKKNITQKVGEFLFYCKFDSEKILNYLVTLTNQAGSTTDGTPFVYLDLFNKDYIKEYINEVFKTDKNLSNIKNPLLRSQNYDIKYLKIPRVLKYTDRLSMINSVEARVPFLDHDLFEYCFSLPNNLKFKNNISRWVFKEATKHLSKNLKYSKNKKHIVDPQTEWLKRDLKEFFMDTLNSNSFKNLYYFNNKKIKSHYEKFIKGEISTSFNLFQIISTYFFIKTFKK